MSQTETSAETPATATNPEVKTETSPVTEPSVSSEVKTTTETTDAAPAPAKASKPKKPKPVPTPTEAKVAEADGIEKVEVQGTPVEGQPGVFAVTQNPSSVIENAVTVEIPDSVIEAVNKVYGDVYETSDTSDTPSEVDANRLPDTVITKGGNVLHRTKAGLPNTCNLTGEPIVGTWFAKNDDAARAGKGWSEAVVRDWGVEAG